MPSITRGEAGLYYEESGSGTPVILLHSFLCDGEMWSAVAPALARRARVINVDLRGHGRSAAARGNATLDELADDHLAVLDALGIRAAVWAGLSIGGFISMRVALRAPERVLGLALLNTDAGAAPFGVKCQHFLLAGLARAFGIGPVLGPTMKLMFGRTALATRPDLVTPWREKFARVDVRSVLRILPAVDRREPILDRLSSIRRPTLVIGGEQDLGLSPEGARRIAAAIHGAELVMLPEAGHLSPLEHPTEVAAAMGRLLDRLEPSSGSAAGS